jgi:hypothetical protein
MCTIPCLVLGCVAAVMGNSAQAALANTLLHMKVRRSELLELPWVLTCFSRLINAAPLLGTTGCLPDVSAPRIPKVHLWFTGSAGQGYLGFWALETTAARQCHHSHSYKASAATAGQRNLSMSTHPSHIPSTLSFGLIETTWWICGPLRPCELNFFF